MAWSSPKSEKGFSNKQYEGLDWYRGEAKISKKSKRKGSKVAHGFHTSDSGDWCVAPIGTTQDFDAVSSAYCNAKYPSLFY